MVSDLGGSSFRDRPGRPLRGFGRPHFRARRRCRHRRRGHPGRRRRGRLPRGTDLHEKGAATLSRVSPAARRNRPVVATPSRGRPTVSEAGDRVTTVGRRSPLASPDRRRPHWAFTKVEGASFRRGAKGGLVPIRECEWDTPGGFTNGGPGDSQIRFPRSLCLALSYGHIPGPDSADQGKAEVDGSATSFLPPGSARRQSLFSHPHVPPGRVAPVPSIPAGRPLRRFLKTCCGHPRCPFSPRGTT